MAGNIAFDIFARDYASKTFEKFGKTVDETEGRFTRFSKKSAIATGIIAAALTKFALDSVKAFTQADKSQRQLEDAFKRFPRLADVTIDALRRQATAIQNKTGFDNDQINASQAVLAQYKLTGREVQQLTPLLVDYAAKTGKTLPEASATLGKALLGQGRGLKDIGIKFKDTGTTAGNLAELMGGLRTQVGGFAEKEGKTAAGQAAILQKKFEDFKESVGSKVIPTLTTFLNTANKIADWMQKNPTLTQNVIVVTLSLAAAFKVLSIQIALTNAITEANPFVRVATLIIALGTALVYAYQKSASFRIIVQQTMHDTLTAFQALVRGLYNAVLSPILTIFSAILHGAAIAFSWIPGLNSKLAKARDAFDRFRKNVNDIIDNITNKKTFVLDSHVTQATKNAFALYLNTPSSRVFTTYFQTVKLPGGRTAGFAEGGRPPVNTVSIVGERGPELFVPDTAGTIIPNNQIKGGGSHLTAAAIANAVASALSGARFEFDGDGLARLVTTRQNAYALKGPRR